MSHFFLISILRQEKLHALQRQFFEEAVEVIAWGNLKYKYLTTADVVDTLVAAQIQVFVLPFSFM